MPNSTPSFVSAKQLSKRDVRRFLEIYAPIPVQTDVLSDENEKFKGEGIALIIEGELCGLYTLGPVPSLEPSTTLFFPYGGVIRAKQFTAHHRELIQALLNKLKTNSKIQIIISLKQQQVQPTSETDNEHEFWRTLGFKQLDIQVFYQGEVIVDIVREQSSFSVEIYKGNDKAINIRLCDLYREAYQHRPGIPDITSESINKQLSILAYSYLIIRYNNTLIGQATLFIENNDCYIDSIYITRKYWGTGAADILVQSLLDHAKNHGCKTISGMAEINNKASRLLMERFGGIAQHQTTRMIACL